MSVIIDIELPQRPMFARRYSNYSMDGYDPIEHYEYVVGQKKPVISPRTVEYRSIKYECNESGLKTGGFSFDPNIRDLITSLLKDDSNRLSIYQPVLDLRPPGYWKAQAAFRGLNPRTPLWDILEIFRCFPGIPMQEGLKEIEAELIEEYKILDASERNRLWQAMSTEERARANPEKFLAETFEQKDEDVIVLKVAYRYSLHMAAGDKGLHHTSTNAPLLPDGTEPKIPRLLVIGRTYEVVERKLNEIDAEFSRVKSQIDEAKRLEREAKAAKKHEAEEAKKQEHEKQVKMSAAHNALWEGCKIDPDSPPLDILGRWIITAPRIDDEFGSPTQKCSFFLVHCKDDDGACHMWAHFDFIELKGMFRFECPERIIAIMESELEESSVASSADRLVISSDEEDEEDDWLDIDYEDKEEPDGPEDEDEEPEDNSDSDEDEIAQLNDREESDFNDISSDYGDSSSIFYVGHDIKPTFSLPAWDFRWRGHSKDDVFQHGSERYLCTLRFIPTEFGGCTLKGLFYSDLLGDFEFQGYKLFNKPRLCPYPSDPYAAVYAWNNLAPLPPCDSDPE